MSVSAVSGRSPVHSLYVLKTLLAFAVCVSHSPLEVSFLNLPGATVDVFFLISGYFLYNADLGKVQSSIKKSARKILIAILILQPFYSMYMRELGLIYLEKFPPLEAPIPWLLWLIQGYSPIASGHLWFLQALLYAELAFGVFLRLTKGRWVPALFPLLIGLGLLGAFRPILFGQEGSIFVFNFVTRALPYLAIGYYIHKNEDLIFRFHWISIYAILVILAGLEYVFWGWKTEWAFMESWIAILVLPIGLFLMFLSNKSFGEGTWLATVGMLYTGNIYYFHKVVFLLWEHLNPHYPLLEQIYNQAGALIVFLLSLPIAFVVIKVQDRFGWNLLR